MIIILGILAAVVTPRYFSMVDDARVAAARGRRGRAARPDSTWPSRTTTRLKKFPYYAPQGLRTSPEPPISGSTAGNRLVVGDFRLTYGGGADGADVTIDVEDRDGDGGWSEVDAASTTVPWPGS